METFKWALFCYYIFIGTVQVMFMKASGESAKGTGKGLAYNTASAMMLIELTKIMCCLGVEWWQGDASRAEKGESRKTTTWQGFAVYAVPGFLYALENNLKIPATVYLHPHVFALFNNSKVIFAAVGMVILLGKKFSVLQWISMALLAMSLCIAKVQIMLPLPANCAKSSPQDQVGFGLFLWGIVLVLTASFLSGLAGVSNELLLKKRDSDVGLWRKNIWTYQWGVIFNTGGLLGSELYGGGSGPSSQFDFFRGYDFRVWGMIFATSLLGISVSMIMKYFDNVVKCFGGSLILYSTTLASMTVFGSQVDAGFVLGLLVYSVSSYFYAGDHNGKLAKYSEFEAEINKLVKEKKDAKEMSALKAQAWDKETESVTMLTTEDAKMEAVEVGGAVVGKPLD